MVMDIRLGVIGGMMIAFVVIVDLLTNGGVLLAATDWLPKLLGG